MNQIASGQPRTHRRGSSLCRLVGFTVACSLIVACGSGDDDDTASNPSDGTQTSTPVAATVPASQPGSVPSVEIDRDATLRLAYYAAPSNLDPHRAAQSQDNTSLFLVYDRLIHQSPEGAPVAGLATEWSFDADGTALTLELRPGVTFHDGTPFDADAVVANIERAKGLEGSTVASELAVVSGAVPLDGDTVRLDLSQPAASLPLVLSDRPGAMVSPAAFNKPDLDQAPVGSGMYRAESYTPGSELIAARYDDYWDPDAAAAARIELRYLPDPATRLNAIRSGEIDWTSVTGSAVADAEAADLVVRPTAALSFVHLQMNLSREPFKDVRVRQALNHAIDRQGMVDATVAGFGTPTNQIYPAGYRAAAAGLDDLYPYDPETARRLLDDAGYGDGFDLELLVLASAERVQQAEVIQSQLAEIGINVTITQMPADQIGPLFYAERTYDVLVSTWGGRPDPAQTAALLFSATGFSNPGRVETPEFAAAYEATTEIQSQAARDEALRAMSRVITEQALDVPIYNDVMPYVHTSAVTGLQDWISGKPEFRGVGIAG